MTNFIDLTGPESATRLTADSVLVLPLGSIEQHGAHLPLSTDFTIAGSAAEAAVREAGADFWLLPPLAYTKSDEHAWSPGTLWLSWDTLMRVLSDLGNALVASPVQRLVFLNGHGGNSALLQVACRELRRRFGLQTFLMHPGVPADHGGASPAIELGMGVHGGLNETSVMLHLRPDLVHMDLAVRSVPEALTRYQHIGFGKYVNFGWLSDDFGTDGTIGDPTAANPELGKELFEEAVRRCASALKEIATFTPGT